MALPNVSLCVSEVLFHFTPPVLFNTSRGLGGFLHSFLVMSHLLQILSRQGNLALGNILEQMTQNHRYLVKEAN